MPGHIPIRGVCPGFYTYMAYNESMPFGDNETSQSKKELLASLGLSLGGAWNLGSSSFVNNLVDNKLGNSKSDIIKTILPTVKKINKYRSVLGLGMLGTGLFGLGNLFYKSYR